MPIRAPCNRLQCQLVAHNFDLCAASPCQVHGKKYRISLAKPEDMWQLNVRTKFRRKVRRVAQQRGALPVDRAVEPPMPGPTWPIGAQNPRAVADRWLSLGLLVDYRPLRSAGQKTRKCAWCRQPLLPPKAFGSTNSADLFEVFASALTQLAGAPLPLFSSQSSSGFRAKLEDAVDLVRIIRCLKVQLSKPSERGSTLGIASAAKVRSGTTPHSAGAHCMGLLEWIRVARVSVLL